MTETIWVSRWQHDWCVLRIAASVTIALSTVSIILRFWSRRMEKFALLHDDWLIIPAWAVAVFASAANIWLSINIDSSASSKYQEVLVQKWAFATQLGWILALGLTTHSYLSFLWRYFTNAPQGRKLLWCHLLVLLWALGSFLAVIFGLGLPVSQYWTSGPGPQYWARVICTTVIHILIDIAILGIPIPWINGLPMLRFYRNLIFGIFFLGLMTMAATCVRFAYLLKRFHADTENRIEYAIFAVMWMLIEVNTAICVANLPSLGPALIWLPKQQRRASDAFKRLLAYMNQKREENPVGPFSKQILRRSTPQLPDTAHDDPLNHPLTELPSDERREPELSA